MRAITLRSRFAKYQLTVIIRVAQFKACYGATAAQVEVKT